MSAQADGAPADETQSGRARSATLRTSAAILALVAAGLLVVAEFSTLVSVVVGSLEAEIRTITGHENHDYSLLVVAFAAPPLAVAALLGARAASGALVALGAAALVVALAIDLPATRDPGRLPESVAFEDAHARAGPGLLLEIAGGIGLALAGGMLAVFGSPAVTR